MATESATPRLITRPSKPPLVTPAGVASGWRIRSSETGARPPATVTSRPRGAGAEVHDVPPPPPGQGTKADLVKAVAVRGAWEEGQNGGGGGAAVVRGPRAALNATLNLIPLIHSPRAHTNPSLPALSPPPPTWSWP